MTRDLPRSAERRRVTQAVVEAVADAEGVAPTDLTPPLYDAIDLNALERVLVPPSTADDTTVQVTFTYSGYEVTVDDEGTVAIEAL